MLVYFSDQQLAFWVSDAEDGYDVAELKQCGRGRPVRLTDDELATLDNLAAEKRMSRPELACQAISAQMAV